MSANMQELQWMVVCECYCPWEVFMENVECSGWSIRMVPNEQWDWDVPKPKFTEYETLVNSLRKRMSKGEEIYDKSRNGEASDWKCVCVGNDSKYGRIMYSPTLDAMRHLTFNEFYGSGIVD